MVITPPSINKGNGTKIGKISIAEALKASEQVRTSAAAAK
jgi:hypothetical protein